MLLYIYIHVYYMNIFMHLFIYICLYYIYINIKLHLKTQKGDSNSMVESNQGMVGGRMQLLETRRCESVMSFGLGFMAACLPAVVRTCSSQCRISKTSLTSRTTRFRFTDSQTHSHRLTHYRHDMTPLAIALQHLWVCRVVSCLVGS